jgi:hypothetical protein
LQRRLTSDDPAISRLTVCASPVEFATPSPAATQSGWSEEPTPRRPTNASLESEVPRGDIAFDIASARLLLSHATFVPNDKLAISKRRSVQNFSFELKSVLKDDPSEVHLAEGQVPA